MSVLDKFAKKGNTAQDFLRYDMGEDRMLCTLFLINGGLIGYVATATCWTYCPEEFMELFKQRRRWIASTLANQMDIFDNASLITQSVQSPKALTGPIPLQDVVEDQRDQENGRRASVSDQDYQDIRLDEEEEASPRPEQQNEGGQHSREPEPEQLKKISILYLGLQALITVSSILSISIIIMLLGSALHLIIPSITIYGGVTIVGTLCIIYCGLLIFYDSSFLNLDSGRSANYKMWTTVIAVLFATLLNIAMLILLINAMFHDWTDPAAVGFYILLGIIFLAALLHFTEGWIVLLIPVYLIFLAAMFLILPLYAFCNIRDRSWGTRDAFSSVAFAFRNKKQIVLGWALSWLRILQKCCTISYVKEDQGCRIFLGAPVPEPQEQEEAQDEAKKEENVQKASVNVDPTLPANPEFVLDDLNPRNKTQDASMNAALYALQNKTLAGVGLVNLIWIVITVSADAVVSTNNDSDDLLFSENPLSVLFLLLFGMVLVIQVIAMTYFAVDRFFRWLAIQVVIWHKDDTDAELNHYTAIP